MEKISHICRLTGVLVTCCIWLLFSGTASAKSVLIHYSAANDKLMNMLNDAFMKKYPDIEVKSTNLSSGPMTARMIAEKNNPLGDFCTGMFGVYVRALKNEGCLEPYKRKGIEKIKKQYVDPDGFYAGDAVGLIAVGVNSKMMKEKNLPYPKTWQDLVNPVYKGMIMVASPAQSGTGATVFSNLHDMYGGWDYIDKLHKNIFQYTQSGSAPIRSAARGEIAIGVTYDFAIWSLKNEGHPIDVLYLTPIPQFVEYSGLLSGAKHPKEAKMYLDFLTSEEASNVIEKMTTTSVLINPKAREAWKPKIKDTDLYEMKKDYDIEKFANEWAKRYTK